MSAGDPNARNRGDSAFGHGVSSASAPAANNGTFPRAFGSRYVLLKHLATGGMADVFLARQIGQAGFVKECVIKRILPHLARDPQFIEMFFDEARLAARLNHPNVAQVFDHGQEGGDSFIAMEYVEGIDLDRVLDRAHERREKRMPYDIAARVACGIAEGLEHAHKATDANGRPLGIVHRDVTPSNVVVSFEGVPKLLDFGIAKAASKGSKTEVGMIKGKLPYMSPEQVQGEVQIDGRSDIFSLGILLYELTTGNKPFDGDNAAQLGVRILHEEPTPPTLVSPDFPDELEAIVLRALAKKTSERFQSARSMHLELERFLAIGGRPTTSHDVAMYLADRFDRPAPIAVTDIPLQPEPPPSMSAAAAGGEFAQVALSMTDPNQPRPTGPLSLGDAPLEGASPHHARHSLGGGGSWIIAVAIVLVAAVAAGFFALRGYEQKKESAPPTAITVPPPPSVAPPPVEAPKPAAASVPTPTPAADPKPTAVVQPASAPKPSATVEPKPASAPVVKPAPVADAPKVTPLAAEPKHTSRPAHTTAAPSKAPKEPEAPRALPKLPSLPSAPPSE